MTSPQIPSGCVTAEVAARLIGVSVVSLFKRRQNGQRPKFIDLGPPKERGHPRYVYPLTEVQAAREERSLVRRIKSLERSLDDLVLGGQGGG